MVLFGMIFLLPEKLSLLTVALLVTNSLRFYFFLGVKMSFFKAFLGEIQSTELAMVFILHFKSIALSSGFLGFF